MSLEMDVDNLRPKPKRPRTDLPDTRIEFVYMGLTVFLRLKLTVVNPLPDNMYIENRASICECLALDDSRKWKIFI